MANRVALLPAQSQNLFLDKQDLTLLRQAADDIDAAYGETLDPIAPSVLVRLTETSRAA